MSGVVAAERALGLEETGLRAHSHQAKAKKIKEQAAKIKRIPDKHQKKISLLFRFRFVWIGLKGGGDGGTRWGLELIGPEGGGGFLGAIWYICCQDFGSCT